MSFKIKASNRFRECVKSAKKQGEDITALKNVVGKLAAEQPLHRKHRDGVYLKTSDEEIRNYLVESRWVLYYSYFDRFLILLLYKIKKRVGLFVVIGIIAFLFLTSFLLGVISLKNAESREAFLAEQRVNPIMDAKTAKEKQIEEQIQKLMLPNPNVKQEAATEIIEEVKEPAEPVVPVVNTASLEVNSAQSFFYVSEKENAEEIVATEIAIEELHIEDSNKERQVALLLDSPQKETIETTFEPQKPEKQPPMLPEKAYIDVVSDDGINYYVVETKETQQANKEDSTQLLQVEETTEVKTAVDRNVAFSIQPSANFAYMDYSGYRGLQVQPSLRFRADIPFGKHWLVSPYLGISYEKELKHISVNISNPSGYTFEIGSGIGYEWRKFILALNTGLTIRNLGTEKSNMHSFISLGVEPLYRIFTMSNNSSILVGTPIKIDIAHDGINLGGGLVFSFRFNEGFKSGGAQ